MSHWYLPHLHEPEPPDMPVLEYADVREYDVRLEVVGDVARFVDAFGGWTEDVTDVWLVRVHTPLNTQIGAVFAESADAAMDTAMSAATKPSYWAKATIATADLIRPLGALPSAEELLATSLKGTAA